MYDMAGPKFRPKVALIVRYLATILEVRMPRMEVPDDLHQGWPYGKYPDPDRYYFSTHDVFAAIRVAL